MLVLAPGLEALEWVGLGPSESYSDRRAGSIVGRFRSTVSEQYVPYILPQEHGHRSDVRSLSLTDGDGFGLVVEGLPAIGFTASHFTAADLYTARHTSDLEPRPEVVLSLDHAQRGLGTASCGPDTAPRYRLTAASYSFSFVLRPLSSAPLPHYSGPARRKGGQRPRGASGSLAVVPFGARSDLVCVIGVDQREHGAAESAAVEAGAVRPRVRQQLDEKVELRNRHLVVVAETRVALEEQQPGRSEIALGERIREPEHPPVLADDVPQPPQRHAVELLQVGDGDVGRALGADQSQRMLELGPPLPVRGRLEAPLDARVHEQERDARRQVDDPMLEGRAVEQQRRSFPAEEAGGLVEDAARHPDRPQLRPLARERELDPVELHRSEGAQRESDGHLECSRRRQSAPGGQVGVHRRLESGRAKTESRELGGDGLPVPPPAGHLRPRSVGREDVRRAVRGRHEPHVLLRPRHGQRDPELDRRGEHQPTAVVRVLADEVHPARRPHDRQSHGFPSHPHHSSRWTASGENAGRQTATYSAPPGSGVE